tara:strand:+ start:6850 stop:7551 length:702 start_codon:yes stop_codon:yes gene_type:complete
MQIKVILIALLILLAGCTAEEINSENSNPETMGNKLVDCPTNNNSTVIMNIIQGNSLDDAFSIHSVCISLNFSAAPLHSENFKTHVSEGNYNLTQYHRIIDNFMIQGGDFENFDGTGGYASNWYGYCNGQASGDSNCSGNGQNAWTVPDEADNGLKHLPCTISMAKKSAPNTGGSQFFIIPEDSTPSHLDGVHTVFGEITEGCEQITTISEVDTDSRNRPLTPVTIYNATAIN